MLERMVDALGGWGAVESAPHRLAPVAEAGAPPPPLRAGLLVADRYELHEPLAAPAETTFRALDRTSRQSVLIRFLVGTPIDASLARHFATARSVSHPNVCRVHDLVPTAWGPAVIMEGLRGETLTAWLVRARENGRVDVDAFRRIASDIFTALAAIHAHGVTHGSLDARSVLITDRKAVVLDLGFGEASTSVGRAGQPVAVSAAADVRAAAMICWDMWSLAPPSPDCDPRAMPLRAQQVSTLPSRLASGEVHQIYRALSDEPGDRPRAKTLRFSSSSNATPSFLRPDHRLSPGPPPASLHGTFAPDAQALLVTFSQTAPETVGKLFPLTRPVLKLGRSEGADIAVRERTVSFEHALLTWQRGHWVIDDLGSTNGTFDEQSYEPQRRVLLRHGGEIHFGEMRMMLVNYAADSTHHRNARRWFERHDPLTGLLAAAPLRRGLEDDYRFATWAGLPLHQIHYVLELDAKRTEKRMALLEVLAMHRVAPRIAELTDNLLLSTIPVVAGRLPSSTVDQPREIIVVSMVGPTEEQVRGVVDLVTADAGTRLPPQFRLQALLQLKTPHQPLPGR